MGFLNEPFEETLFKCRVGGSGVDTNSPSHSIPFGLTAVSKMTMLVPRMIRTSNLF